MLISLAWLTEFVDTGLAPAELARRLTLAGLAVEAMTGRNGDLVLELELPANRPDCLSHEGVARELAAVTARPLRAPALWPSPPRESAGAAAIRIRNLAPQACGRYCARVLEEVAAAPAPARVTERLETLGQRPVHAIADLTNYVLFETGQPTHAFDLDTLHGGEIQVRFARPGETLVTLDEVERKLDPADLVIADAERAVALAGVMGGAATAMTAATRRVLIESAWFDPLSVRRSARRHGLQTEAARRFERGADFAAAPRAADRIAAAAQEMGATVAGPRLEVSGELPVRPQLRLRLGLLRRLLGIEPDAAEVRALLQRLGFAAVGAPQGDEAGVFQVPSWRADVSREVDLVEEVARIRGYDTIPARMPAAPSPAAPRPEHRLRESLRQLLRGRGYAEAVTLSFASQLECSPFAPGIAPVPVRNPLSDEATILRTSPLPAMLHLLRNNLNRGAAAPRLFELGKCYELRAHGAVELPVLSFGACGAADAAHWRQNNDPEPRGFDFFDLKGDVEAVLAHFDAPDIAFAPLKPAGPFHPGRAGVARWRNAEVARFGQLHPEMAEEWKLPSPIWIARIDLEALLAAGPRRVGYVEPSRFPGSERDFSFLFPEPDTGANLGVNWHAIVSALRSPPVPALQEVVPLEIYRGTNLEPGHYSLLLRARLQSDDHTLRDDEVQATCDEIVRRLRALGGRQR